MILAPAIMTAEKDPKVAAAKCLESVQLDPESYRIGHTKASWLEAPLPLEWFSPVVFDPPASIFLYPIQHGVMVSLLWML